MKQTILAFGLVVLSSGLSFSNEIGLLPQDKVAVNVSDNERNPFGMRMVKPAEVVEEKGAEEAQIRLILSKLPVKGVMEGRNSTKVLLGSLFLEQGRRLPPVIEHQTERLLVKAISNKEIEIVFLDKDNQESERKISIPLNVKPAVRYILGSESDAANAKTPSKGNFGGEVTDDETTPVSR